MVWTQLFGETQANLPHVMTWDSVAIEGEAHTPGLFAQVVQVTNHLAHTVARRFGAPL